MTEGYPQQGNHRPRARGWASIPPEARYDSGTRMARDVRRARAKAAARSAIAAAWSLAGAAPEPGGVPEARWSLRGEPRSRQRFADPHPADFTGGLARPGEYPVT
jgi:hypothetical protein